MTDRVVYAEIRLENCSAELYVNDVPLIHIPLTNHTFHSQPVQEYLVSSLNELSVVVNPGPTPSTALQPTRNLDSQQAWLEARIVEYEAGQMTGEGGRELGALAWNSSSGIVSGHRLTVQASVPRSFGPWAWQSTSRLTLNDATRAEAARIIRRLHHAFSEKLIAEIVRYSHFWLEEDGIAYPALPAKRRIADFNAMLIESAPKWTVAPLDEPNWDLRLCGGGRLIDCINRQWQPIIRTTIEGQPNFEYRMFLGRISDLLVAVR